MLHTEAFQFDTLRAPKELAVSMNVCSLFRDRMLSQDLNGVAKLVHSENSLPILVTLQPIVTIFSSRHQYSAPIFYFGVTILIWSYHALLGQRVVASTPDASDAGARYDNEEPNKHC